MPEPRGSYGHFCAAEFGLKENIFNGFSENPPKRRARSRLLHRPDSEPRDGALPPAQFSLQKNQRRSPASGRAAVLLVQRGREGGKGKLQNTRVYPDL